MNLEIDETSNSTYALIRLSGSLDIFSFNDFNSTLEKWLENKDMPRLLVDLKEVTYMGSSGWSALMRLASQMEHKGGRLVAFGAQEKIQRTLSMLVSGKRVLLMEPDLPSAVKMLDAEIQK